MKLKENRFEIMSGMFLFLLMFILSIYLISLKKKYPYLFSLVVRVNPFDQEAKAEIT